MDESEVRDEETYSICQDCHDATEGGKEFCQPCREKRFREEIDARNRLYYATMADPAPEFMGFIKDKEE